MRRLLGLFLPGVVALVAILVVLSPNNYLANGVAQVAGYLQTFDGTPATPTFWRPVDWDVTIFGHNMTDIQPMDADHGPNCEAPPATHHITLVEETVFICNNHVITAIKAGYGAVYLTPNQLLDFSHGPAVLKWDMSTNRTSPRDWVDIVIMPFDLNNQVNFIDVHVPQEAVHLNLGGADVFLPSIFRNFTETRLSTRLDTWDTILAAHGLTTSAVRRDTFELTLSTNHIRFRMPAYDFTWFDMDISPPLTWSQGVIQLNHRTYNPEK